MDGTFVTVMGVLVAEGEKWKGLFMWEGDLLVGGN
jgi:hypothetical protein